MSTIATSGRCVAGRREEVVGVADLGDHLEARVGQKACDPFAEEQRVVGKDKPQGHPAVDQGPDRGPGELVLGDEARGRGRSPDADRRRSRIAARGQHDQRRRSVDRELAGDLEPLDVGQADVQQHEVGPERRGQPRGRKPRRPPRRPRRSRPLPARRAPGRGSAASSSTIRIVLMRPIVPFERAVAYRAHTGAA